MMTEEQRVARGQQANVELALTDEAFAAVRAELVNQMLAEPDPQAVYGLRCTVVALDRVRHAIKLVVSDGQMAADALNRTKPN